MKHQFAILLFTLFFTLTSANRIEEKKIQINPKQGVDNRYFAPLVKTNNIVIKTKSEKLPPI